MQTDSVKGDCKTGTLFSQSSFYDFICCLVNFANIFVTIAGSVPALFFSKAWIQYETLFQTVGEKSHTPSEGPLYGVLCLQVLEQESPWKPSV